MIKFPRLSDKARRTCKIGNNTLIGPSTRVHDEAQVTTSTIGARCSIGAATVLRNAYIFNDVTIGPNCVLESCIIGAGVQIGEGSRIARGSLVADGVKLGPGTVLRSFDRVSKRRQKSTPTTIGNSTEEDESDEGDADSELEEAEQSTLFFFFNLYRTPSRQLNSQIADLADSDRHAGQASLSQGLGPGSDAFVWPRRDAQKGEEEVYENEVESFNNRRLMRLGAFRCRVANACGFLHIGCPFCLFYFISFQATTLTTLSHPTAVPSPRKTKARTKRTTRTTTTTTSRRAPRCPPPLRPLPRS